MMHYVYELNFPVTNAKMLSFIVSLNIKYSFEAFHWKREEANANIPLILYFSVGKTAFEV